MSSPSALAGTAAELGYKYVALVDELNVGGAVELHGAAQTLGLTPIVGATLPLRLEETVYPVVIIAASRAGYRNLNDLITRVLYDVEEAIELDALLGRTADLFLLTGGRSGFPSQLLAGRQLMVLERLIGKLKESFKNRLFIQLYFDHHPGDARRTRILRKLGMDVGVPVVAAPQVRYARKEDYPLYDALVCARLGITVDTPHPERPQTRAACVPDPEGITKRFPFPEALSNAAALANEASFALLPERLLPPLVRVPDGWTPEEFLRQQCYSALPHRYSVTKRDEAASKLEEELSIIAKLELAEFFLAAAEVMDFCHSRGILAAGRGSAAASITCYLLGITRADPLEHGLLFERFLHGGKTAMPDVDIDISSRRRQEVLDWVEERFGGEGAACEAMVANRITYRLRSAIQDVGRALGVPPEVRNKLSHALGRDYGNLRPHRAKEAEARFSEVLGNAPVKKAMLELLASIEPGLTRHFAPHSGGTVLSRYPLSHYSPQFKSKNGMRVLQFDKDDAEQLGLIKLDLLGLRMLGALELAREEVYRLEGLWLDFTALPDDPEVWRMIDVGETLTLFQIESPGQTKLSVDLKPKTLTELAHQIAIHRPGPIQSGTVRPYLKRHKGLEPIRYAHPVLEAILGKTYGVVLFQEDVLRLAVNFAGMSWADGDRFRKAVSKAKDAETIDEEREAFVAGAHRHVSATREQAEEVFAMIQGFRGYGFAQSHAFAFAQHAYASAWLKYHYPAEWLSAVLNELPGMWPLSTLRQDAKTWGVSFFKLDINASGVMWRVERNDDSSKG
ncbi:MAG: DNA polymerase III subunit alpha, partial [Deinococcota bacterium]|nr:DNA polymerase III subunit alpha [Deinococcota bacterium]